MIVVSDTSPLSALITIEKAPVLPKLFGTVIIPPSVAQELMRAHPQLPVWLRTVQPDDAIAATKFQTLDRGEAEAIALALQVNADYLLIDEKKGRDVAKAEGLRVVGALGVIALAKRRGLIETVRPAIDDLQIKAGFFISERLRHEVLLACGEHP